MAPIARELSPKYRVIEPLQRVRGAKPLTVATHIRDQHDVLTFFAQEPVHLVGSSWGAMLALAYAAEHQKQVRSVVAIGCGTFDVAARDLYKQRLNERLDATLKARIEHLDREGLDDDEVLRRNAELLLPAYSQDLITTDLEHTAVDARGNKETWSDMLQLQATGVYPQSFARIEAPVLMLHGALDPHPGPEIRASLAPYIQHLEYHEWPDCGHYPWLERSTRGMFYERLTSWFRTISAAEARSSIDATITGQSDGATSR
jgi:pimeloyl-ACP methyl ester carboxylesterase